MRLVIVTLVGLMLMACSPLTPPPAAELTIPATYSIPVAAHGERVIEDWWLDVADPQLKELQAQLVRDNLNLRQAFLRLDQLEARQRTAQAGLFPTLTLNGGGRREQTVGQNGENQTSTGRLTLAAAYEIDLWQRLRHRTDAAELRLLVGEEEVRTLLLSLSARLAELYFIGVEQRAQLDLLKQRLDHNQELVRIIAERYQAGLAAAAELYQAQQNLAQMEAQIPLFEITLNQTSNAMALLLGQPPGHIRIERTDLPTLSNIIDIGLPASLLRRRPDVSAALLELDAADRELAAALADRLPRLDLSANIGRSVTRLSGGDVTGTFWSLALGLTQPLLDGGRLKAASDLQLAIRDEKQLAGQLTILTAIEEVESALLAEQGSFRREQLLEQQQEMNNQVLKIRTENYLLGLTDSLELLRSEMAQLDVRSQQLSNRRQLIGHRISLIRALGGHWLDDELPPRTAHHKTR
ncbi:efflux transporter outer membrane subunit [Pelovirga terrestris]|uniref:Efflux transporter outer membrane subunit n=1 Tax=Pelovirga terrestris TaxID=2771352 RepID=A0A8J6QST0_9BACT|nr:efflux transporter outer membrane subunit [Pelovirga terrestris]MBD1401110.1 efflux transporter outer membrane subunit [Pelovirga terrestris]